MGDLYSFSKSQKQTLERIKTPLLIFQVIENRVILLAVSDGAASFFNSSREEVYKFSKSEELKLIKSNKRQNFDEEVIHSSKNVGTPFSINLEISVSLDYRITASLESEKTEDGSILCYVSFFDINHNNIQKIEKLKKQENSKNVLEKSYLNSLHRTFLDDRFLYWIYDVKNKQMINDNCFDSIIENKIQMDNYPKFLFDSNFIAKEDEELFNQLLSRSINKEESVEGNIRIYSKESKNYFLQHLMFQTIFNSKGEVSLSIITSERFDAYDEFNKKTRKILNENGLITWNYLIKQKTFSFDQYKSESKDIIKNASLIIESINNGTINMNIDNILKQNNSFYQLVKLRDHKNEIKVFEITSSVIKDKSQVPYSILSIARDVSKFYNKEKEYIEQLEKANINKSNFLSRLSHDLRTPLGAITSLATFGFEETMESNSREYFAKIGENSEYILSFIADILETKLIEQDAFKIENKVVSLSDFFKHIYAIMELRASEKNIKLDFDKEIFSSDIYLYCDKRKLKQVTINLLTNSIKYTNKGGTVKLEVKKVYENDIIKLTFILSDNGVGMSKEFQKHMYDQYTQEHNGLSYEEEGTGLGLSIVKKIMDHIVGGEILCESELGKGTTFTIKFSSMLASKEQIEQLKIAVNPVKLEQLKNKRVLLCEDKAINVMIVKKILSSKDINIDVAENGLIGLNKIKENNYDAILMDIRMPKMDGLTTTREVRKFNKKTPIIALSANAYAEDIKKSIESGMNDHIAKPINKDELFNTLYKYLNC